MTINNRDLVSGELRYSPSLGATLRLGYTINSLMPDDNSPLIFITHEENLCFSSGLRPATARTERAVFTASLHWLRNNKQAFLLPLC